MSLTDHPNEEAALKLRMAKKASPRERPFWYRIFFISLWHGSKNGATSRPSTHHVGYPNTDHTAVLYISLAESLQSAIQWLLNSKQVQNTSYLRWRK
ncbi:hypothetical protein [Paenibacillus sp. CH40]|uniref:hypothetical protein n=1 Tax=Paenibacillus sp. CH40 TaxID=2962045 RepID=UPI0020B649E1|nr:hypothetical protein [Paenibacillus sp. CH40]MCP3795831.1 hypothetical protein [Paenibacillus sp. CH40]